MTNNYENFEDKPATADTQLPSVRVEPDGTVVHSSHASLEDLYLGEARQKVSEQNRRNSHHRDPLKQKKPWQDHVRKRMNSGDAISSVMDLLVGLTHGSPIFDVAPATLRKWAKEAEPRLKLKAGRPAAKK